MNPKEAVKSAMEKLKGSSLMPKSPPTLRKVPHPEHGQYHMRDNSISLPADTNVETAQHEIVHSGDPHKKLFQNLVVAENSAVNGSARQKRLLKIAHRVNLRSEARANTGMARVARNGMNYYKRLAVQEMGSKDKEITRRLKNYYAHGGADALAEDKAWLKLSDVPVMRFVLLREAKIMGLNLAKPTVVRAASVGAADEFPIVARTRYLWGARDRLRFSSVAGHNGGGAARLVRAGGGSAATNADASMESRLFSPPVTRASPERRREILKKVADKNRRVKRPVVGGDSEGNIIRQPRRADKPLPMENVHEDSQRFGESAMRFVLLRLKESNKAVNHGGN